MWEHKMQNISRYHLHNGTELMGRARHISYSRSTKTYVFPVYAWHQFHMSSYHSSSFHHCPGICINPSSLKYAAVVAAHTFDICNIPSIYTELILGGYYRVVCQSSPNPSCCATLCLQSF
ncbi:hypothetical protein KP509_04G090000 [Ceratopteris richardii]|uniref:Uncharacterized protein n=1 Tax=Ceratopteris richardii TaxID=49495 RepID=A0A8T2V1J8_CERRI|nr:hypothetical protein KP509_04G090000 [Ceratopteris richardii]